MNLIKVGELIDTYINISNMMLSNTKELEENSKVLKEFLEMKVVVNKATLESMYKINGRLTDDKY